MLTINDSLPGAKHAIPVKGQHYWEGCCGKEKPDCSVSVGMMRDEYELSPRVSCSLMMKNRSACY